jgi:hypothetical protein
MQDLVIGVLSAWQGNTDAADILGAGEALAYGVSSAVAVADVRRKKLATVLAGGHRGAAFTTVAWCASRHSTGSLRLAVRGAFGHLTRTACSEL